MVDAAGWRVFRPMRVFGLTPQAIFLTNCELNRMQAGKVEAPTLADITNSAHLSPKQMMQQSRSRGRASAWERLVIQPHFLVVIPSLLGTFAPQARR